MHYHCEIVIPDDGDIAEHVERAMAPHREGGDEEGMRGFWDWYQIGGRYTGAKNDYDPTTDPANIVVCDLCFGTGKRDDALGQQARERDPSYTCNGCQGEGKHVSWPTQWVKHDGDTIPVSAVSDRLKAYTLILPDGEVLTQSTWDGDNWVKTGFTGDVAMTLRDRGITEGRLVTVDYHS